MVPANFLIVGTGRMGIEYANTFRALGLQFTAVGLTGASAENFEFETGEVPFNGNLDSYLKLYGAPQGVVVAVSIENLVSVSVRLVEAGCSWLLVEKPGALDFSALQLLESVATRNCAGVFIALNRRFLPSIVSAKNCVDFDGGLIELDVVFGERIDEVRALELTPWVKEHWVLANSIHVLDVGLYLAGGLEITKASTTGSIEWHPSAAQFYSEGITSSGAVVRFHADWSSPGSWKIEFRTASGRYVLSPLEKLSLPKAAPQLAGDSLDFGESLGLKPGFYGQLAEFTAIASGEKRESKILRPLSAFLSDFRIYCGIAGYGLGS